MNARLSLIAAALLSGLGNLTSSQPVAVIFHDLSATPYNTRGRMQLKAVVTDQGSVGIAEVVAGAVQAGHHHQQEQIVLVTAGRLTYSIGGATYDVGTHNAVVTPSNSHHFYTNANAGSTRFIEYQPVRRDDWLPPFPANKPIQSAEPVPVAPDQLISRDMSLLPGNKSGGIRDRGGARITSLPGATIRLEMVELSAAGAALDSEAPVGTVRFVYVLAGTLEFVVGSATKETGADMVVEVPAGATFKMRPLNNGPALVAIFSRLP